LPLPAKAFWTKMKKSISAFIFSKLDKQPYKADDLRCIGLNQIQVGLKEYKITKQFDKPSNARIFT